jgi:glycosyltransferase involved in cell wall biosynthesis
MRIALVVHKFPPASVGGTEIYTQNLAQELAARGHEVFVFYRSDQDAARGGSPWEERAGFRAYRFSRALDPASASPWAQFMDTFANRDAEQAFERFLREINPDIVHFQHVMLLSYRLIEQARRYGLPVILTLHDYWFLCSVSQLVWPNAQVCRGKALGLNCARCVLTFRVRSPLMHALRPVAAPLLQIRDALVRRAAHQADLWIAPSHFLIQQYIAAGFPEGRFVYLENGIDLERIRRFAHQPSVDGRVRVTFLGSLAWQKGVHILVEAFNGLPADVARLRIWGDPKVFPAYTDRLRRLLSHPDAQWMGGVANDRVGEVLADTDVMVLPSLWYENSPVAIQEARAAGVPVVASGLGALAEKVHDKVDGLLFPPGDAAGLRQALQRLVNEPDLLSSLRRGTSPAMDMPQHVQRLEEIYDLAMSAARDRI